MYNVDNRERSTKWDVILLVSFIAIFIITAGSTIFLVKEAGQQTEKLKTGHFQKSLYLAELETFTNDLVTGDINAIGKLTVHINKMRAFDDESSAWIGITRDAEQLKRTADTQALSESFFDRENIINQLKEISERANDLASSKAYQHPVISNYIALNTTMDLVSNLYYSGELEYVKDAYTRINQSIQTKGPAFPYIQNYPDVLELYQSASILDLLADNAENLTKLLEQKNALLAKVQHQAGALSNLTDTSSKLEKISLFNNRIKVPAQSIIVGVILAIISLVVTLFLIMHILKERAKNDRAIETQNQKNEEAIYQMLEVIDGLSQGDLTVQAKVTDHFTGTLADSFNMSVEELRALVKAVGDSSSRLASGVHTAIGHADEFTEASLSQAMQITEATNIVSHVTKAMLDVSTQTSAAVDIAMSSTEVARSGSERVRSTITGMDQIREHIQETSKRIKRLGESSQEIGDVVELINDIADQTHILALNAAIQASAAGEAGKGFAVVADEVQRLAERTGNATSRVEALVKTIQSDTNEAIFAMEKSTSEVVNGANLAERAGESLTEIESVSGRLAGLIQSVSQASREVSELGSQVQSSMTSVKGLSEKNVENTKTTKAAIEALERLADELRESISGFKI